jgi:hypothetical protein
MVGMQTPLLLVCAALVLSLAVLSPRGTAAVTLKVQTTPSTTNGVLSARWENGTFSFLVADDFDVPTNEIWSIDEVRALGFGRSNLSLPTFFAVFIFGNVRARPFRCSCSLFSFLVFAFALSPPSAR